MTHDTDPDFGLSVQRRRVLAGVALAAALPQVRTADAWPSRPIRLVVPFAPGGSSEIVARATAVELTSPTRRRGRARSTTARPATAARGTSRSST